MFSTDDTITAIATPAGRGGIGVVRISGPDAHAIARRLTRRHDGLVPRHATFARLITTDEPDAEGAAGAIDEVVCTFFPCPHSYTGEDVVEISAHGSPVVLARILEETGRAGARLAGPGEFTFRAYLHGRIDLVQAEAVADLIEAVTPGQARAAFAQLDGTLTEALRALRERVFDLVVRLEASLDFADEDYHFITREELRAELARLQSGIDALLVNARAGQVLREGALVVISGRPNVGKSSLFNALVGASRAIVTAVPGTTRDLLTERADVGGIPITFVDTAGVREATDEVEREGVARARRATDVATLQLVVLDRSESLTAEDRRVLAESAGAVRIVVAHKTDLPGAWRADEELARETGRGGLIEASSRTGKGLDDLRRAIYLAIAGQEAPVEAARVTNVRHARLLSDAGSALEGAIEAARDGASEEFVLSDVMRCVRLFDQITGPGASDPEAILASVFSRFCIGK